jgi:hypothetical protein
VDKGFDWGAVNLRVLAHEKRVGDKKKSGAGFGIGGNYKLTDKDLLMGQYTKVDGDIDNLYGANGYTTDEAGNVLFDKNWGVTLGYAHTFDDKLRGTVAYGYNKGDMVAVFDNRTAWQTHVNFIYSPIKNVELGAEYIYGQRKTFAAETGTLSRFDLMGRYSF